MKNTKLIKFTTIAALTAAIGIATVPATQTQAATPKLSQTSMTIYAQKTKTLTLKNNTKGVKWSSTKPSVASVKKGKVKAKKAGKATIKATVGRKTYKCKVTVKNPYLSATSVSLQKDETATLKLTGTKAQSYHSSDKTIASATSKGKVIARKEGTATINVTDTEGRTYRCTVTVTAATVEDDNTTGTDDTNTTGNTETGTPATTPEPVQPTPEPTPEPIQPTPTPTPSVPAHQHRWANHWAYDTDGKAYSDTRFCMDTTCAENKGFGTDDGWRDATLPGYDNNTENNNNTTEPDNDTNKENTENNNTSENDDKENTVKDDNKSENNSENTENKEPEVTEQPEVHHHSWTIPVLEEQLDKTGSFYELMLVASKCETCGETSDHRHAWDKELRVYDGPYGAYTVTGVECSICGETMDNEGIDKFTEAQDANGAINYFVEKNLATLPDLDKARKACRYVNSWEYGNVKENITLGTYQKKAMCTGSNAQFVAICKAAGLEAQTVDVNSFLANHVITKVKIDGEWLYADATAGGGIFGFKLVTEDGFDLWCDYMDGIVTDEEYDNWMPDYER